MKNGLHYFGIAIIIILSFFCYSSNFYPQLGSDDAIQVLMIYYFKLPHDLYFWGQDRYGSLIPLIGQVFFHGFGVSALTSESITHYLFLIAGYFAFAAFFKSCFSRLILGLSLRNSPCYFRSRGFQSRLDPTFGSKFGLSLTIYSPLLLLHAWLYPLGNSTSFPS